MTVPYEPHRVAPVAAATTGVLAVGAGYVATALVAPALSSSMAPWILGRGLGVAAYVTLTALTVLGLWLRHPWRMRRPRLSPATTMRLHAGLAAATGVLVVGHVTAIALDSYAGVGWMGALVPGQSGYRTAAVALGTVATYAGLLVGATAALAGRFVRRAWLPIHRLAALVFVLVWGHGVLAGSDTVGLRAMYGATGALVLGLAFTRRLARARSVSGTVVVP